MADLPACSIVLAAALVDSINPCAIGVLILLISTLVGLFHEKKKMLTVGLLYIAVVYVVYLLAGLGLITFLYVIPMAVTRYLTMLVALAIIIAGIIEIKDYFYYGRGFSLSIAHRHAEKIPKMIENTTLSGIILLGAFVAMVELPCTGGPYLAITFLLSKMFNFQAFLMLVMYNFVFVLPLLVILFTVYFGADIKSVHKWKQRHRKYMRLMAGIVLIALGILLGLIGLGIIAI